MMEFNATLIIAVVSFAIFIVIMNAIFYKPIYAIINKRNSYVDETLNAAKNSADEADAILEDKENKITANKKETREIIRKSTDKATKKSGEILENAKLDAKKRIKEAKTSLAEQVASANEKLTQSADMLSDDITAKILGEI